MNKEAKKFSANKFCSIKTLTERPKSHSINKWATISMSEETVKCPILRNNHEVLLSPNKKKLSLSPTVSLTSGALWNIVKSIKGSLLTGEGCIINVLWHVWWGQIFFRFCRNASWLSLWLSPIWARSSVLYLRWFTGTM